MCTRGSVATSYRAAARSATVSNDFTRSVGRQAAKRQDVLVPRVRAWSRDLGGGRVLTITKSSP